MKRHVRNLMILLLVLTVTCLAALFFGSVQLSPADFWKALTCSGSETNSLILWQLRFPRILAGIFAGIGLSSAGVLLQSVTSNALASPNILGINSGAGLAVILVLAFLPVHSALLPVAAFAGAFAAALIILGVSSRMTGGKTGILLIGIAVTTLLNALISFLSLLDEDVLAQYNHFTLGSIKDVHLGELVVPAIIIGISFSAAMLISSKLAVLSVGDAAASALGICVRRLRVAALACAAASAASVVSFAGLLGFVGLVVPHIARRMAGERPARLLPTAALLGAILVVLADLLGRVLFAPTELPVGILMSLIGAPYFLILLFRRKNYAGIS